MSNQKCSRNSVTSTRHHGVTLKCFSPKPPARRVDSIPSLEIIADTHHISMESSNRLSSPHCLHCQLPLRPPRDIQVPRPPSLLGDIQQLNGMNERMDNIEGSQGGELVWLTKEELSFASHRPRKRAIIGSSRG